MVVSLRAEEALQREASHGVLLQPFEDEIGVELADRRVEELLLDRDVRVSASSRSVASTSTFGDSRRSSSASTSRC